MKCFKHKDKPAILFAFGTRPELIKLYYLIKLIKNTDFFDVSSLSTGQHNTMLDEYLFSEIKKINYSLNVSNKDLSLVEYIANLLPNVQGCLSEIEPDFIVVQGDTISSFVCALAASLHKVPVIHLEAGLRTGDFNHPFPEEQNRVIISHMTKFHFCPTAHNKENLLAEGIDDQNIFVTGNTGIDTLLSVASELSWKENWSKLFKDTSKIVNDGKKKYILVTGHRRESFGEGFLNICNALKFIAKRYPEISIIYPVHLNPHVQKPVFNILSEVPNIYLLPPLDYAPFVFLMKRCYFVLTDSGGIQEEAPSLGKPVLVMRNKTERLEAIEAGTAKLVGTSSQEIINHVSELLDNKELYQSMSKAINPYGDGKASERIVEILKRELITECKELDTVMS